MLKVQRLCISVWLATLKLLSPGVPSDLITCVYMRRLCFDGWVEVTVAGYRVWV